jgi:hypothetical protein
MSRMLALIGRPGVRTALVGVLTAAGCGARSSLPGEGSTALTTSTTTSSTSTSSTSSSSGVVPSCSTSLAGGFVGPTVFQAASTPGLQDIYAGGALDLSSTLVQHGVCSTGLSVYVVDELPPGSGVYQTLPVPPVPGVDMSFEERVTMEVDGLTLIATSSDTRAFLTLRRSAPGRVDFGAPEAADFVDIAVAGAQSVWAPAISADGLAFYYTVMSSPSAATDGIYESVRASTSLPFPAGTRMPAEIQSVAQYVNGISPDKLFLFVELRDSAYGGYATVVFSRAGVADPFTNPNAPNPPPRVPGLRSRPLAGCTKLAGTCSPGGCTGEDVCTWTAP